MKTPGQHLAEAAESLRTGPFTGMRAMTVLSIQNLRDGADRQRREANQRRHLADFLEANGVETIMAYKAIRLVETMRDDD